MLKINLMTMISFGLIILLSSCNKEQMTNDEISAYAGNPEINVYDQFQQLSGFYTLDNIPLIYNKQDVDELMKDKEDADAEKLNRFLYEIGLATRDLTNDPSFNKLMVEMAKDINTGTVYLLDLKTKAPKYYDHINQVLSKKNLSLEYIADNMTHKPLTGNPEFPETMEIEKYEPTIEVLNYEQANVNIQPVLSPNLECQLFEDKYQDHIVAWVHQEKGGFEEIILGEETVINTTNPVFTVNHSISKEIMERIGKLKKSGVKKFF